LFFFGGIGGSSSKLELSEVLDLVSVNLFGIVLDALSGQVVERFMSNEDLLDWLPRNEGLLFFFFSFPICSSLSGSEYCGNGSVGLDDFEERREMLESLALILAASEPLRSPKIFVMLDFFFIFGSRLGSP
jgi:hypothetical protein